MNLLDFLEPVSLEKPDDHLISHPGLLGKHITIHTPDLPPANIESFDLVFLGVPEDRNSINRGASLAPDRIRTYLFQLFAADPKLKILDLGNLKQGNTFKDTYIALREVLGQLLSSNITVVLLGGTQELTVPAFQTLEELNATVNLTTIDRTIDIEKDSVKMDSTSYLTELLFKKRTLFKYTNIGHQAHFTDRESLNLISRLYHEALRLGSVRADMTLVEPVLRDSQLVSFDMGAIRMPDAPAHIHPSPTGFSAEESCQLARYSGISDNLSVFGIFELNPKFDSRDLSARLAAQMIWYFLDGFSCKNPEDPQSENHNFKTFIVGHSDLDHEITFYKSLRTERWWMEIPNLRDKSKVIISCTPGDYQLASEQEVPDLWWKSFQKMS